MARIIQTADLEPGQKLSKNDNDWIYNALDCCVTLEVRDALVKQLDNSTSMIYNFSRELQAPILEMSMRGVRVDRKAYDKALRDVRYKIDRISGQFDAICIDGIGQSISWRSPAQVKKLFYEILGIKPILKRSADGIFKPTVNREALEKMCEYFLGEPLALRLLSLRDLDKKRQFLETNLDKDNRVRTSYNIAGTNTGRLASSITEFDTGCVRPTAEALTRQGWKRLDKIQDGELIAQWDKGHITFTPATFFWTTFKGDLLQFKTEQISLAVTPDHRVVSSNYNYPMKVTAARTIFGARQRYVPLSGRQSGSLSIPTYAAMLMADCSKEGTVWRTQIKKERKIKRLIALLNEHNVRFNETAAQSGYRRFTIYADITLPKKWGAWVLDLDNNSAEALVKETQYWDSHIRGKSFIFYSADKEQAEWFQTLCHMTGRSTTIRCTRNSDLAYGHNSLIYSVNVKPKTKAQILAKHWHKLPYDGVVGCPTVASSYWLVREDGFISVTGNTNLQNVDRELRYPFISDPGYKFCNIDLRQGDSRNVGAICWELFNKTHGTAYAGAYLDACESGDLHTAVSRMVWRELGWTDDPKANKRIAEQLAYRGDSYRQLAKKLGHGTNYVGTPRTMAKHTKTAVGLITDFQSRYFGAFPCIKEWHKHVAAILAETGQITTIFGRRRSFFGRPADPATIREAVAYEPQSLTADEIDTGLLKLWRNRDQYRIQLLLQVHDSILFQYPEELEGEVVPWTMELVKLKFNLSGGREFVVPTDAKIGWNWGDVTYDKEGKIKDNEQGLMEFNSSKPDTRKRVETKPKTLQELLA